MFQYLSILQCSQFYRGFLATYINKTVGPRISDITVIVSIGCQLVQSVNVAVLVGELLD